MARSYCYWPGTLAHLRACVRLHDMSGTNMVLWPGTCPARPGLCYATDLGEATATDYFVCMYVCKFYSDSINI